MRPSFLCVQDQGDDPQMHGIEQIIESFRQLPALLSVIEIDQRKCQDPEDLYFISIQKTRQQIMAVTVDPRDRAMGDHDMRHIPYWHDQKSKKEQFRIIIPEEIKHQDQQYSHHAVLKMEYHGYCAGCRCRQNPEKDRYPFVFDIVPQPVKRIDGNQPQKQQEEDISFAIREFID